MAVDPNNPLGLEIEVEGADDLKKALAKSEKAYLAMASAIGEVSKGLEEDSKESKENEEEHTRASKKTKKERGKLSKALTGFLAREREAAAEAGFSFKNLAGVIGGGALIGAVVSATRSFVSWDNELGELRSTIDDMPGEISATGDQIRMMSAELGISRQELIQTTKQMADLGLAGGRVSSEEFINLRKTTVELARGMDVATGSVVDLMDTFSRTYKLPHHRLRGIATSMKFIQEQTGMTGEEVLSFAKSLDEVQARMTGDAEARADMVRDFGAVAGALKQAGVDAEGLPKLFAAALDPQSDQGAAFLGFLEEKTGKSMEAIRRQLEAGDVAGVTELFIESLGKTGPRELRDFSQFYEEMTGMSLPNLLRLGEITKSTFRGMVAEVRKSEHDQRLLFEAANERQNKLTKSWNTFKIFFEDLWLGLGEIIATVSANWVDDLKFLRDQGLVYLQDALEWFRSAEGKEATQRWMEKAIEIGSQLGSALKTLWGWVEKGIEWWKSLDPETKSALKTLGMVLVVTRLLGGGGGFGGLLSAGTSVLGMFAKFPSAGKSVIGVLGKIGGFAKGALTAAGGGLAKLGGGMLAASAGTGAAAAAASAGLLTAAAGAGVGLGYGFNKLVEATTGKKVHEQFGSGIGDWLFELAGGREEDRLFEQQMRNRQLAKERKRKFGGAAPKAAGTPFTMAPQTNVPSMLAAPNIAPVRTPRIPEVAPEQKGPEVVAVKDSGTTDMILRQIHSLLGNAISRMGSRPAPLHPSRPAIAKALGG